MFLLKANQFISSQDARLASRFVDDHQLRPDNAERLLQDILDDLAAWNPQVIPYIQELPYRNRAILLHRDENGKLESPFWGER
jgi:hypothetical protein